MGGAWSVVGSRLILKRAVDANRLPFGSRGKTKM